MPAAPAVPVHPEVKRSDAVATAEVEKVPVDSTDSTNYMWSCFPLQFDSKSCMLYDISVRRFELLNSLR